jgi:hypothetical protein
MERAVDDREGSGYVRFAGLGEPGQGRGLVGQGISDVDDGHPPGRHRHRLRFR